MNPAELASEARHLTRQGVGARSVAAHLRSRGAKVQPSLVAKWVITGEALAKPGDVDAKRLFERVRTAAERFGIDAVRTAVVTSTSAEEAVEAVECRLSGGYGYVPARFRDMSILREVGKGTGAVYAYRYPDVPGLLKIGSHQYSNGVKARVGEQLTAASPGWPEISLVIYTDEPQRLESQIHRELSASKVDGPGREWFRTTVERVLQIHQQAR
jgi:hypothetical protein